MDFGFWFTLGILVVMTVVMVTEWLRIEMTLFIALILLILGKVITPEEAFAGFANTGLLTIAVLFVIAGSIHSTGLLNQVDQLILGRRKMSATARMFRFILPLAFLSAFTNNTPLVAMMTPVTLAWTRRKGLPPSKFLMPLSFAVILGGVGTLIGTSTTLIIHGLLIQNGYEGFSFFEISTVGVPVAVAGLLYVGLFANRLLPERRGAVADFSEQTREFVVALSVTGRYPGLGQSVENAGLRHLKGLFLFQIERDGQLISPTTPDEIIRLGDRLYFTGLPETIVELQRTPGLELIRSMKVDLKHFDSDKVRIFEAVISPLSPLVGKNVRESNFRERYDSVILAVHRSGERIRSKIGDIVMRAGDTLLILGPADFYRRWYHSHDFYLVSSTIKVESKPLSKKIAAITIMVIAIVLAATGVFPLIVAGALGVIALILCRCLSLEEAEAAIDYKVLAMIGTAFGISAALTKSGVAEFFARYLIEGSSALGVLGALGAVYGLTSIYTTLLSNNATAAIVFPIALSASMAAGASFRPFAIAIALAASMSFATPISYQTNLMVYGPGGYRFTDYVRFGLPLQVLTGVAAIALIYALYL